jgi:Amino acid transporters
MPIGIIASLIICTVLYVLMSAVLTGIKKYTIYAGDAAAVATAFASKPWAQALVSAGALAGTTSVLLCFSLGSRDFHGDGARRFIAAILRQNSSAFRTPHITTIWTGVVVGAVAMVTNIGELADLRTSARSSRLFWFASASTCCAASTRNDRVRFACRSFRFSHPRRVHVPGSDAEPAGDDLDSFCGLARNRTRDLFPVQRAAQQTRRGIDPGRRKTFLRRSSRRNRPHFTGTHPTKAVVSRRF